MPRLDKWAGIYFISAKPMNLSVNELMKRQDPVHRQTLVRFGSGPKEGMSLVEFDR